MSYYIPPNKENVILSSDTAHLNDLMSTYRELESVEDPTNWFAERSINSRYLRPGWHNQKNSFYRPLRTQGSNYKLGGLAPRWAIDCISFQSSKDNMSVWRCTIPLKDPSYKNKPFQFDIKIPEYELNEGCLYLWPGFKNSEWENYLLWDMTPNNIATRAYKFNDTTKFELEEIPNNANILTYQHYSLAPDLIELTDFVKEEQSLGCFFMDFKNITSKDIKQINLAIDLGSANSTVTTSELNKPPGLVGFNLQKELCPLFPAAQPELDKNIPEGIRFGFLGSGIPWKEPSTPMYSLPTAPIHIQRRKTSQDRDNSDSPLAKLLPLFQAPSPDQVELILPKDKNCGDKYTLPSDIKWEIDDPEDLRPGFIQSLGLMAIGNLIEKNNTIHKYNVENFYRTYPLSDKSNLGTSGFCNLGKASPKAHPREKSESQSNFDLMKEVLNHGPNQYLMLIDLGGGTTDISFGTFKGPALYDSLGPSSQAKRDGGQIPLGRFGGKFLHQLLDNLVARKDISNVSPWNNESAFIKLGLDAQQRDPTDRYQTKMNIDTSLRYAITHEKNDDFFPDGGPVHNRIFVLFYSILYYAMVQGWAKSFSNQVAPRWKLFTAGAGWKLKRFLNPNIQDPLWIAGLALDAVCRNFEIDPQFRPTLEEFTDQEKEPLGLHQIEKATVAIGALTGNPPVNQGVNGNRDVNLDNGIEGGPFRVVGASFADLSWKDAWWRDLEHPAWKEPHGEVVDRAAKFDLKSPFSPFTDTNKIIIEMIRNTKVSDPLIETLVSLKTNHAVFLSHAANIIRQLPTGTHTPEIIPTPLAAYFHSLHQKYLISAFVDPNEKTQR